jgi:hypothetical protein
MPIMDFLLEALYAIVLFFQEDDKEWNLSRIIMAIVLVVVLVLIGILFYR